MRKYEKQSDGRFITSDGYLFNTEGEAEEYCRLWNEHFSAMEQLDNLPVQLTREAYEQYAHDLKIEIMSDQEIKKGRYALHYGEYGPYSGGYRMEKCTPDYCLKIGLARKRLVEMEATAEQPEQRDPDYPDGKKLDCGHIIYYSVDVMMASFGTSCADCYDRMSDSF